MNNEQILAKINLELMIMAPGMGCQMVESGSLVLMLSWGIYFGHLENMMRCTWLVPSDYQWGGPPRPQSPPTPPWKYLSIWVTATVKVIVFIDLDALYWICADNMRYIIYHICHIIHISYMSYYSYYEIYIKCTSPPPAKEKNNCGTLFFLLTRW